MFQLLNVQVDDSQESLTDDQTALCTEHYMTFYKILNPENRKCGVCKKPLSNLSKSQKCPDPEIIQNYLVKNTDFSGEIGIGDHMCYACYRAQLIIIKHLNNTTTSTYADLVQTLDRIKSETCDVSDIHTLEQAILYASRISAVHVGEALLKQNALLLPDVYESFSEKLLDITKLCRIDVDQDLHSAANSNWLRSQLSSLLEHHMAYQCKVKRNGTVLYRYGGDLMHALSFSLSQARNSKLHKPHAIETDSNFQSSLSDVCLTLNSKIHDCAEKMMKDDAVNPHKIEEVDIDKIISELDSDLWKAMCLLTKPHSAKNEKGTVNTTNTRKVRQLFCICTLLFVANHQCSFPLHTLIADAIETCGGSSRLTRLLNRLGVCVSTDTHARYVQHRVKRTQEEGVMSLYPQNAFTVVSADNLDFVHSHARVYCGKQQSSWHGTTVQVVQPKPLTLLDTSQNITDTNRVPISVTQAEATTNFLTSDESHPQNIPATGTLETRLQAQLSKRSHSTISPLSSPSSYPPIPKRKRRMRTGTENKAVRRSLQEQFNSATTGPTWRENIHHTQPEKPSLTIQDFQLTNSENISLKELKQISTQYILLKVAGSELNETCIDLQTYFSLSNNIKEPECSNIVYFKVLDQKCDDKETLLNIISDLYEEFILSNKKEWVILEGDQATYERLQSIKREYGNDLTWMVPFPGDWHFLKNFQEVLLKIYFDAGLCDLAKASKYLPNSIGTNFKRTHHFLLECWESLYRHFLNIFLAKQAPSDFIKYAAQQIKAFPSTQDQTETLQNLKKLLEDLSNYQNVEQEFTKFMEENGSTNMNSKFWAQFIFQDCFSYISLYLAMRSGKWDLRMAAIKSMAALFTAFDRPNYQKLIPQHIVDMLTIPNELLSHLTLGGFTVSITGRAGHSVGIDEAHEMCINKECKEYITKPSADYIQRTATFLPVRAKAMKNIESQIFPDHKPKATGITTIKASDSESKKLEMNVQAQVAKIKSDSTLTVNSQEAATLHHLFNQKEPSPEQVQDLMGFRKIGQTEFESRVEYYTLRNPSVMPPKHRKRLLTFTERKSRRRKVSEIERERKLQIECWKKRVAFATSTGTQISNLYQQCLELPRAIATSTGQPVKGTKANTTKAYEKRYEHAFPPVFRSSIPPRWIPTTVVMEGMFLINITPWSAHKSMGEYGVRKGFISIYPIRVLWVYMLKQ